MPLINLGLVIMLALAADTAAAELAYVRLDPNSHFDTDSLDDRVESADIQVVHIFPQEGVIVHMMDKQTNLLRGLPGVAEVVTEHFRNTLLTKGRATSRSEEIFLYLTAPDRAREFPATGAQWPAGGCVQRPELPHGFKPSPKEQGSLVPSVDLYTAEYMAGRVALVVMLMESAGGDENWTTQEENIALGEIVQGADWLSSQAEQHGVRLSWVYEFHTAVPTAYEPIQDRSVPYYSPVSPPLSWEFRWIDDALSYLGAGSEWDGVFHLANTRRQAYKSDWAYEVYVVMDNNDADHQFTDGKCAYYWPYYECCNPEKWPPLYEYPSPLLVMTYNNDGWGWWNLDRVFSHETGHVFGAPDEYAPECSDCGEEFGYLHVPNGNCEACNPANSSCIMGGDNTSAVCSYTVGHWGWNDSDGDGPVDAIDPNYPRWQTIFPVQEGDVVRIYAVGGDLVKTLAVTADNRDALSPPGYVIWDGLNNYGWPVAPLEPYMYSINNGSKSQTALRPADLNIHPAVTNINFNGELLSYRIENSFAYVRCFLYDEAYGYLVGRPVWDKQRTADHDYTAVVDTAALTGPAIARFYAWRPDGGASDVTEFRIRVPKRGDINLNGIAGEVGDAILFSTYFIFGNGVWNPLDRPVQVAATDVNGDGDTLTLPDYVYLVRVITGDANILAKPSASAATASLNWRVRDDTLLVDWSSDADAGGLFLQYDHTGTGMGEPVLTGRAAGMRVLSHDDGKRLRVLISGIERGARIPGGEGQILAIPVGPSAGRITLSKLEAADYWGNPIAADTVGSGPSAARAALSQNVPNPFNASTRISFYLPCEGEVNLRVYNVLGQLIANLVEGALGPGQHELVWDGVDPHGHPVATGVYFYSLHFRDAALSKRMVVVK